MLKNVFEGILIPAIKQSENMGTLSFVPAVVGFWSGILFLLALDHLIPHLHVGSDQAEIRILGELPNDDIYDFVLLTVRENQLYEALTELKNNKSNTIVTMINSLDSYNKWEDIVGNEYFSLFTLAIFSDYAGSYIWKQFWR